MQDRSWQDRYADPGDPIMHYGKYGRNVILTADGGDTIFLIGDGASDEGDRPFLDSYSLKTGETHPAVPQRGALLRKPGRAGRREEAPGADPARIADRAAQLLPARPEEQATWSRRPSSPTPRPSSRASARR